MGSPGHAGALGPLVVLPLPGQGLSPALGQAPPVPTVTWSGHSAPRREPRLPEPPELQVVLGRWRPAAETFLAPLEVACPGGTGTLHVLHTNRVKGEERCPRRVLAVPTPASHIGPPSDTSGPGDILSLRPGSTGITRWEASPAGGAR